MGYVHVDLLRQQSADRCLVALLRRVRKPDIFAGRGHHGGHAHHEKQGFGAHQIATSPVLSPNDFSSSPSLFPSVRRTLAMGVPCGHRRWRLPLTVPVPCPAMNSGSRLCSCTFESPIGLPYSTMEWSSNVPSPSGVCFSLSRKYGI